VHIEVDLVDLCDRQQRQARSTRLLLTLKRVGG
jgi:hypothetical protein